MSTIARYSILKRLSSVGKTDLSFTADVVVDGVQKDHSVDRLQGTLLPFLGDGENLIRNPADGGI